MSNQPTTQTVTPKRDEQKAARTTPTVSPLGKPQRDGTAEAMSRKLAGQRLLVIGILAALALAVALVAGALPRLQRDRQVNAAASAAAAPPRVTVVAAGQMKSDAERVLPGNSQPLLEAALYARTTGYLKRRLVDIGDRVKEGQLLVEISAPDVDDQVAQAQANLAQARANLVKAQADNVFAQTEEKRFRRLVGTNAVSQEDYDSKVQAAAVTAAVVVAMQAAIRVNEAAVQRYTDLQNFQKITAPFPGVITARTVDAGDLISADSPSTTRELFHLMRTDVLRVFVNVPQVFATGIKVGQDAVINRREDPLKKFSGKVTRTADALDPNTRTLLTEVQVQNREDALRPGMYLQVKFVFDRNVLPVVIPAAALATRTAGPRVAVLDDQNRVQYRTVELGRDFGAEITVISGLKAGETVVVHPGDDLPEGMAVEPVPVPTSK